MQNRTIPISMVMGLMLTMLLPACKDSDLNAYNPTITAMDERALGDRLYESMLNHPDDFTVLTADDYPALHNYLDQFMYMVEIHTEIRSDFNWDIIVLQDERANAFTLPGGKICLTTGLLKYLEGGHELFAIIGHEAHYADRIDRNGQDDLSPIMKRFKETFAEDNGTGVFIEVIKGDNPDLAHQINLLVSDSFAAEPQEVFAADAFSMEMICGNYVYSPRGLLEVINRVAQDEYFDFEWLANRPPQPDEGGNVGDTGTYSLNNRIDQMQVIASGECSVYFNNTFSEEYEEMIADLP